MCDIRTEKTETMFLTNEIQAAIVEATRALGYSKVKLGSCSSTVFEREAVKLADSPFRSLRFVSLALRAGSYPK